MSLPIPASGNHFPSFPDPGAPTVVKLQKKTQTHVHSNKGEAIGNLLQPRLRKLHAWLPKADEKKRKTCTLGKQPMNPARLFANLQHSNFMQYTL